MYKVGDKVTVYRKFVDERLGWIKEMDYFINKTMTISFIENGYYVKFAEDISNHFFPFECIRQTRKQKLKRILSC